MKYLKNLNRLYLDLIYKFGEKLKKPVWMLLSLWLPLSSIILLINFELIDIDLLTKILTFMGIPVVYATILLTTDSRNKRKKYTELKQLGIKVFGNEIKFSEWMNSTVGVLNNKKPIDVDPEKAREVLIKIDNGIYQ